MKIKTQEKLQELLDADLSWRKKELIDMRLIIQETKNPTLVRAGLALLSAHFEGFLKQAANYYVVFVSNQKIPNALLKNSFFALQCKKKIISTSETEKTTVHTKLIDDFLVLISQNFSVHYTLNNPIISTESNPSSEVFEEIVKTLSLDFSPYETKRNYIDSDLLKNRHGIVHGEKCYIDSNDFFNTFTRIIEIMEDFNQQILNAAMNKEYLKENVSVQAV